MGSQRDPVSTFIHDWFGSPTLPPPAEGELPMGHSYDPFITAIDSWFGPQDPLDNTVPIEESKETIFVPVNSEEQINTWEWESPQNPPIDGALD
jgi:hypothetical protein